MRTSVPCSGALSMAKLARLASTSALVNGRPRPVPLSTIALGGGDLTKRLQRSLDILVRHPDPGIAHPQDHLAIVLQPGRNDDLAAGLGEFDRVGQKVQQNLT